MSHPTIDGERFWRRHLEMSEIGATAKGGLNRLALTDEDRAARDMFVAWCKQAGARIKIDQMGNVFARREGRNPSLPPIAFGSHNDSQPTGGRWDGTYGVQAAAEILATLNDLDLVFEHPVEAVLWSNEEGVEFRPPMLGSAVHAGLYTLDFGQASTNKAGRSFRQELERIGYLGEKPLGEPMAAYFEVHIEQGPVLEREGLPIGVVTGVQGVVMVEIRLDGFNAHAGPAPMEGRRDAFRGAAEVTYKIMEASAEFGPDARCTVCRVEVSPGAPSVVPDDVFFTVDIRHPDKAVLNAFYERLKVICAEVVERHKLGFSIREDWTFEPLKFDADCIATVRNTVEALGYPYREIVSGAGHDAVNVSYRTPTAMIFIPCRDGLSHNEAEHAEKEHAIMGCNVLLGAVIAQANKSA